MYTDNFTFKFSPLSISYILLDIRSSKLKQMLKLNSCFASIVLFTNDWMIMLSVSINGLSRNNMLFTKLSMLFVQNNPVAALNPVIRVDEFLNSIFIKLSSPLSNSAALIYVLK